MRGVSARGCVQVLNIAPCSNLSLVLPRARFTGLQGWAAVGQAVGALYAQDIWDNQVRLAACGMQGGLC